MIAPVPGSEDAIRTGGSIRFTGPAETIGKNSRNDQELSLFEIPRAGVFHASYQASDGICDLSYMIL
jgi:hypothetical protein